MNKLNYKSDLALNDKVLIGIVRAGELFKRVHDAVFRKYGMTFPQYNVLRVLISSEKGQNTSSNVGKIMLVSGANITGIAKRLEKSGFLLRKGDPRDERVTLLQITSKGRLALRNIEKERVESLEHILEDFSEEDKNQMLEKIRKILKKEKPNSGDGNEKEKQP
jgi:MarR family 2-MHQ and catechol resistance regulon transcriptional repressor